MRAMSVGLVFSAGKDGMPVSLKKEIGEGKMRTRRTKK